MNIRIINEDYFIHGLFMKYVKILSLCLLIPNLYVGYTNDRDISKKDFPEAITVSFPRFSQCCNCDLGFQDIMGEVISKTSLLLEQMDSIGVADFDDKLIPIFEAVHKEDLKETFLGQLKKLQSDSILSKSLFFEHYIMSKDLLKSIVSSIKSLHDIMFGMDVLSDSSIYYSNGTYLAPVYKMLEGSTVKKKNLEFSAAELTALKMRLGLINGLLLPMLSQLEK